LAEKQVDGETVQLVRGLSPGEDLVKFAEDNGVGHIFIGVEKISRARKILLGSTAQFVILKGPCPVTTVK
jgi:nucleotide-binding universal stress UspA family protein